jgi:sulfatase maturation enzyme AslB (radical SAM superfamily)
MLPDKRLELVHLQLTRSCNLRCWFCGQWGKKGFFADSSGSAMTLDEWEAVIDSLVRYRESTGISPDVMLWGGEPLMSPDFEAVTEYLVQKDFALGMVTNGVLLDKHMELCKNAFKRIYVSVDGPKELHDQIRGNGVYDRVAKNLLLLQGGKAKITIMTVISPEVVYVLSELPDILACLKPDEMLLHEMIALTVDEAAGYAEWLKNAFGMEAHEIYSWQINLPADFAQRKKEALKKIAARTYPFPVRHLPHGEHTASAFCLSPFVHIHIAWNGRVMYCTDFYDFSAGNVKNGDLIDIFGNELSDKFRSEITMGRCVACNHCAWKNNETYLLLKGNELDLGYGR